MSMKFESWFTVRRFDPRGAAASTVLKNRMINTTSSHPFCYRSVCILTFLMVAHYFVLMNTAYWDRRPQWVRNHSANYEF
jgi:hypothetical protein